MCLWRRIYLGFLHPALDSTLKWLFYNAMIKVKHLTRRFGSTLALSDLSFEVAEGRIVGFLGPNGAGKSTTMKILTGSLAPTSGTATVAGFDVMDDPLAVRRLVGFMPENVVLYTDDTVFDFLRFVAELKGVPSDEVTPHLNQIMKDCGLGSVSHKMVGNLSHGYTKRVGLAQALVGDPPVLILDEPTSGLDPHQIVGIRDLIKSFSGRRTVMISSHILSEISATCDHILILKEGVLVMEDESGQAGSESDNSQPAQRVVLTWDGNTEAVAEALRQVVGVDDLVITKNGAEVIIGGNPVEVRPKLVESVILAGGKLQNIQDKGPSLEDMFLSLTGADIPEPADDPESDPEVSP